MTKIMKVEFLEALIWSNLISAPQEDFEALKREDVCPRPLSLIEAGLGLEHDYPDSQCSLIQFPTQDQIPWPSPQMAPWGWIFKNIRSWTKACSNQMVNYLNKLNSFILFIWSFLGAGITKTSLDNKVYECIPPFTQVEAHSCWLLSVMGDSECS